MNLFQKYGIKEVADVVFYSINEVGDEEFYTPVLYLDTLKVSTLEKTSEKVFAQGGYGNKRLIGWNFGKEITLNLEDALFSPASMSLIWGGQLNSKLSDYTSAIVKCNLANKYAELGYSTKAYPSPALTDEEWNVFDFGSNVKIDNLVNSTGSARGTTHEILISTYGLNFSENGEGGEYSDSPNPENGKLEYFDGSENIIVNALKIINNKAYQCQMENITPEEYYKYMKEQCLILKKFENKKFEVSIGPQKKIMLSLKNIIQSRFGFLYDLEYYRNNYFKRNLKKDNQTYAIDPDLIEILKNEISKLSDIGYIDTKREDTEVIDRMEKCIVTKKEGFTIDTQKQKENLFRYYANDESSSYTIYYDAKTMLPLLHIENDQIIGWNASAEENSTFKLKLGTVYYKWTRTVKRKESEDDGILGRTLVIDAETFPDSYRIVGETYIREQKTGKDQRYQFTIFKANVSADTSVTLQADGDPTTFSMTIDVLTPPNDIMMELKEYDVEEDLFEGGTRIVPQKSTYTYTPAMIEELIPDVEDNNEMY